ncbi:MAG: c-type cytochrome [Planctomycetaceae bacterium]|nr:c-type cytochrome [Planctomycetaceae bacterium]
MKRLFFQVLFFGAILFSVLFFSWTVFSCDYLGPTDIVADEAADVLYILERDARQIRKIHAEKETYPEILQLPVIPERMRWFPDQQHLAIVGGSSQGHLLIVDIKSFKMTADIPVGHSPSDVAVFQSREQTMIYVANRFDGTISVVEQNKETKCFEAGREPIALTVTPDGQTLIIAGHLPEDSSLNFDISSRIRFIDTQTGKATPIRLDSGAMNLRDLLLSPEGRYVFVTGNIGHFQQMPNSVTGGWMNENILFVADIVRRRVVTSYRLDDYAIGSANPWGLSLSGDGRFLVLAAAGSGDILLINRIKLIKLLEDDSVQKIESITSTTPLDALLPTRMRIPVGLKGVRHAVMSKDRIFATAYFEDAVAKIVPHFSEPFDFVAGILPHDNIVIPRKQIFPLDSVTPIPNHRSKMNKDETDTINKSFRFVPLSPFVIAPGIRFERSFARLGAEPVWTDIRYGEMLFHDAHLCQEHWQSCATCHPDARSDTLNWDLLNDGPDNPKNTKSLLFSHETPPSMAHGVRDRAETAVRKGFATILMLPVTEREAEAVDAYLSHLQPVPSPHLVAGQRSESAKRGRRIFDRSGCSLCHPEPLFTDGRKHNVGTRSPIDSSPLFDTPTLREVWRTAPYLHDGRYKTIRELITDGKHVNTDQRLDQLTNEEINDLIEYILSL